jgi:CDP-alcohol phosphatidyltransferase
VKPQTALADKGRAVEEWADLHFFRPIGARIARALEPTRVSADDVTMVAILIGLVAGHLFYYESARLNALGLALFIISDIFDSADGQLARLRGTSTRRGRILDGIGDNVRFANLYAHLLARLVVAGGGWYAVALVAVAGLSHSFQSAAIDFIRNAYLFVVDAKGELDLPEDLEPDRSAGLFYRIAQWIHRGYVTRQAQILPRSARLIRALRLVAISSAFREDYAERQRALLPQCAWLGQNLRFLVVGIACIAGHPGAYLWIEITLLNVVLVTLLAAHETNAAQLQSALEPGLDVYAGIH